MEPRSSLDVPASGGVAAAVREAGVVWLGIAALGVGFGAWATSRGLPWWLVPLISASVLAGSVEFLLVGLIVAHASLVSIAVTTLLVNSRHLVYGLSFPLERVRGPRARLYSVFALCDEAYALLTRADPAALSGRQVIATQLGIHLSWVTGSLSGAALGAVLLRGVRGVGFVLPALVVVLALDAYAARPDRVTVALALASAAVAQLALPTSMLPVALGLLGVALLIRSRTSRRATRDVR